MNRITTLPGWNVHTRVAQWVCDLYKVNTWADSWRTGDARVPSPSMPNIRAYVETNTYTQVGVPGISREPHFEKLRSKGGRPWVVSPKNYNLGGTEAEMWTISRTREKFHIFCWEVCDLSRIIVTVFLYVVEILMRFDEYIMKIFLYEKK